MKKQRKNKLLQILCLLGLIVLSTVTAPVASFAGLEEVGECEMAMGRCALYALLIGSHTDTMINCMIGYAFCKKYVESC